MLFSSTDYSSHLLHKRGTRITDAEIDAVFDFAGWAEVWYTVGR